MLDQLRCGHFETQVNKRWNKQCCREWKVTELEVQPFSVSWIYMCAQRSCVAACICSHMCVRRLHRAFSAGPPHSNTQCSPVLMAGICVQSPPLLPACTMTQEFTLRFHRALPSTAALLTRAQRFNYWPVPVPKNRVSWAAQEIASRRVKVVTGLLDSEGESVHTLFLCALDCVVNCWQIA